MSKGEPGGLGPAVPLPQLELLQGVVPALQPHPGKVSSLDSTRWRKVKQSHLAGCHDAKCSWEKVEAKDGDEERGGGGDPGLGKDGFGQID